MKKILSVMGLLVFGLTVLVSSAMAEHCASGKGECAHKSCQMGKGDCADKDGGMSECPITAKFFKKAYFFLENKDEIGLSADQIRSIKALELDVKKITIKQTAGMQIFFLDIEQKMSEESLDVEALNTLIDSGSAAMASDVKSIVSAYAKLKATLTEEQMTKAKAIWMSKK